ncbi:VOC family protein [Stappia stellulata]|uniref:VOC family protein n=1 Tax=Stappia stellulata TaxID=71235 RepID=UPI0004223319|nr:VOC family protein [Stappia stellulata]
MKIERLDRVALGVRDIGEAAGFFEGLLGIRFDAPLSDDKLGMDARYSREGLELVAGHPGSVVEKFTRTRGEGVFCVVFKVSDMDAAVSHFRDHGLEPVNDVTFGALREVAFHPAKAHGLQIVLAAYPEPHPATAAAQED